MVAEGLRYDVSLRLHNVCYHARGPHFAIIRFRRGNICAESVTRTAVHLLRNP